MNDVLNLGGTPRILFLARDGDTVRAQLAGRALSLQQAGPLRDDVSTDEITPLPILTHYDDICGIRLRDGTQHRYFVRCGRHADPRASQVKMHLFSYSRDLTKHFYSEARR